MIRQILQRMTSGEQVPQETIDVALNNAKNLPEIDVECISAIQSIQQDTTYQSSTRIKLERTPEEKYALYGAQV